MADVASMSLEERAARFSPLVSGTDRVKRPAAQWAETPVAPGAGGLERVFAAGDGDMWVARRFFPMIPYVLNLPTTMAVHRDAAGSLTLFNALRLAPEVEEELLALGPVRRVVKLGQFHGAADAYYAKDPKFESPEFWTLNGGSTADGMTADKIMTASNVPIEGSLLYELEGSPFPEAILCVPCVGRGRALITSDVLVHLTDTVGVPLFGRAMMNMFGFISQQGGPQPAPLWLRSMVKFVGKPAVQRWYADVLALDFAHVVSAHGTPVVDVVRSDMAAAIERKLAQY